MNDELIIKTHFPGPYSSRQVDDGTEVYCTATNNTVANVAAFVYDQISGISETPIAERGLIRSQIIDGSDYSVTVSAMIVVKLNAE